MKTELYKKVYIKSEDDLPKEEGEYFCNRSGFNTYQHLMTTLDKSYMREIRWYLQPIELPDETEIITYFNLNHGSTMNKLDRIKVPVMQRSEFIEFYNWLLNKINEK